MMMDISFHSKEIRIDNDLIFFCKTLDQSYSYQFLLSFFLTLINQDLNNYLFTKNHSKSVMFCTWYDEIRLFV
jgi:type IV secretory pathway TraG/TraD family ATPase VirD4